MSEPQHPEQTEPSAPTGEGWTTEVSSGLALAGFLFLVFVGFTLLAMGPLTSIDAYFNLSPATGGIVPVLHILDRIGQRAVCLPILAVATLWCCRRARTWRPAWLVAVSVFGVNLFVLILKVGLGRAKPKTADPSFFAGGMAYPSGHTANILLVYGIAAYLLARYARASQRTTRLLWATVFLLSMIMVATSLTLTWHWFADLVAGLLIGGCVLQLTVAADHWLPPPRFSRLPFGLTETLRFLVPLPVVAPVATQQAAPPEAPPEAPPAAQAVQQAVQQPVQQPARDRVSPTPPPAR